MDYEKVSCLEEQMLEDLLKEERYRFFSDYEIKVIMYFKYGKRDRDGNLKKSALIKNGVPCAAMVRVISPFNRHTDNYDVKIILNGDFWRDLTKEEKIAVIDHELSHIRMIRDREGEPVMIDENSDKVKLGTVKDDIQMWGFNDIIVRHGKNSQELQVLQSLVNRYAPLLDLDEAMLHKKDTVSFTEQTDDNQDI